MKPGGFAGSILSVDLSKRAVSTKPIDKDIAKNYIGGLGICIKLASDLIPVGAEPLSRENTFVLGAGPLVGTSLPSASRLFVVTKLPASKTVGWCGAGGYSFGVQLKSCGYDHIVVTGRADKPVYLYIEDEQIEFRDASALWGLGVESVYESICEKHNGRIGVLAIGPAGEHCSSISMAFVDRISTLGRGGFGAVMGSKNLKAIVVKGNGGIKVANRKRFSSINQAIMKAIKAYPYLKEWQDLGMFKAFPMVPLDDYKNMKARRVACVSCPVGCKDVVKIPEGPYAGIEKHTSSAINLLSPMMYGMKNMWESCRLVIELDNLGLDMFEFFNLMEFAKKLTDSKIIQLQSDESEIDVKSFHSMISWAKKVAFRKGTGDLLADGVLTAIERIGPAAKMYAGILIKGIKPYAGPGSAIPWDRFGTMELGQVLDPRGPHVGSGGSPTYFAIRPLNVFPKHLNRMGVPDSAFDRIIGKKCDRLNVGRLLRYSHAWFATLGSLGICARGQVNRFYSADICAEAYASATGIPTTKQDLAERANRIWKELRDLNIREGLDDSYETFPEEWFGENGFKDYITGKPLTIDQAEKMKLDYYKEWGWVT
ncbi:aldehyde ferredoxin oxidoreductase N-terminal domain-containing protein [Thermodesulfobacteriota bacterium]